MDNDLLEVMALGYRKLRHKVRLLSGNKARLVRNGSLRSLWNDDRVLEKHARWNKSG